MFDYTLDYAVDYSVYIVHCTVDYNVYVVHCTVDCSIDRCVGSCTDYDFSSMIFMIPNTHRFLHSSTKTTRICKTTLDLKGLTLECLFNPMFLHIQEVYMLGMNLQSFIL